MFRRILTVTALTVSASLLAGAGVAAAHGNDDDHGKDKGKPAAAATTGSVKAKVSRGTTTLTLSATVPGTLKVRRPATSPSSGVVVFPITWGKVTGSVSGTTVSSLAGTVAHVGGIEVTTGSTKVTVKNLVVADGKLSAQVKVNRGRTQRLELGTLSNVTASIADGKTISATATVSFNAVAQSVLGTANATATVNVTTRVIGKVRPG